jgi:hypothetical protein
MADLQELIKAIKQDKESNGDRDIKATLDLSELLGSNDNLDTTNYLLALKYIKVRRNILNALIKKTQGGKLRGLKLGKEIKISDLLGEPPKLGLLTGLKWLRVKNQILKKVGAAASNANFEFGKEIDINDILGSSPEQDFITKTRFFLIRQKLLSKISDAAKAFNGEAALEGILGIEKKSDEIEGIDSSKSLGTAEDERIATAEGMSAVSGLSTDESLDELRGIHTGIDNIYDHLKETNDVSDDTENAREQIARNERRHQELLQAVRGGGGFMGSGGIAGGDQHDGAGSGLLGMGADVYGDYLLGKGVEKGLSNRGKPKTPRPKGRFGRAFQAVKNLGPRAVSAGKTALALSGVTTLARAAVPLAMSPPGVMAGTGIAGYLAGTGINNIPKLFGSEDRFSDMMGRPLGNKLAQMRGVDMSGPLPEEKILELQRQGFDANKPIYEKRGIYGFRKKVITGYEKLDKGVPLTPEIARDMADNLKAARKRQDNARIAKGMEPLKPGDEGYLKMPDDINEDGTMKVAPVSPTPVSPAPVSPTESITGQKEKVESTSNSSPTETITGKKTDGEANYKMVMENAISAKKDLDSFEDETVEGKDYEMIDRPQGYRGIYYSVGGFDEDGDDGPMQIRKYKDPAQQKKFIELENAEIAAANKVDQGEVDMLIDAGMLNKRYGGEGGSRRLNFRQNLKLARARYVKANNIDIYAGTERGSEEYYRAQSDDISYGGRNAIRKNILGEDNTFKPTEPAEEKSTQLPFSGGAVDRAVEEKSTQLPFLEDSVLSAGTGLPIAEDDMTEGTKLRMEHNKSFVKKQDAEIAAAAKPTESITGEIKPDIKQGFGFIDGNPVAVIEGIPHMYGTTMTESRIVKAYGYEHEIKGEPAFYIKKGVNNLDDDPSNHIVHPTIYEDFKKSVKPLENGMGIPLDEKMIRKLDTAAGLKQLDPNSVSASGNIMGDTGVDTILTAPDLSADANQRDFNSLDPLFPGSSGRVMPGMSFESRMRQSIAGMDADETAQIQARSGNFKEESAARMADTGEDNLTNTAQPIRRPGVFGQTQGLNGFANKAIGAIAGPDFQAKIRRVLSSRNPIGEGKKLFDRTKNRVEGFGELSPLQQGVRILNAPVPTGGSQLAATQSQNQDLRGELTSSASSVTVPTVINNNNQRSSNVTNSSMALEHVDKTRALFSKTNLGW